MSAIKSSQPELVCLVDVHNRPLGDCRKSLVHGYCTPLHRAFSTFLFDRRDRLLLQRRALAKPTWPGVWSNTCCGHPAPGEETTTAARRRLREELGLAGGELHEAVADFRYRSRYRGIEENEICPVLIGRVEGEADPDPAELDATAWIDWDTFIALVDAPPGAPWGELSVWSRLEARLLHELGPLRRDALASLKPFTSLD
jgi:isopentenyl-diphosphate delta-isomerase type 1